MIKKGIIVLGLLIATMGMSIQAQQFYNVLEYGGSNDSTGLNTEAIAKAIDAAADKGGGTVYFPAGKYITGPIHFKSNITLFIDAGAELHFSDDFDHYLPMVESRWEGTEVTNFSPLIYGTDLENIAIVGRGLIDGHGKKWWGYSEVTIRQQKEGEETKWQKEFKRLNKDVLAPDLPGWVERGFLRPPFIQFLRCENVQIKDIKIQNSPFWTVNPQYCDNVTIDGVTIYNPESPNTDGINPESCRNVHIANCHISVGDDCITIKSGKDRSGRKVNIPAENYTITNCTMLNGHGGVVIGSEMSGGVKNIVISNCIFDGTDRGIRLKTARGRGGVVENIRVSNIVMRNIRDQAIVLNTQYAKTEPEPVSERTPQFKNIHISNMSGTTNRVMRIRGLEEMPIENISVNNINMQAKSGFEIENAKHITFNNVQVDVENEPFLQAKNVHVLNLTSIQNNTPKDGRPMLVLADVTDANIQQSFPSAGTDTFVELVGDNNKGIFIHGNNFNNVRQTVKGTTAAAIVTNNIEAQKK
ncbi:glycoside hydrolase family 28 protein [Sphingobacterium sp. FBM7-1]|uniref:glycoside hydrolase family 28 protein n=1 Tax=Sphingobacterium sp. FBM7-1 TaxID=2886688 RepID=UPI001D107E2B|nr:glycoside hydrolase family 28 protein [Sphingobacterium sp. FBM7-1]MCC2598869.1 glycoside hydrolase family 28 protein [Sphingobacterium sp. FBM7-1]